MDKHANQRSSRKRKKLDKDDLVTEGDKSTSTHSRQTLYKSSYIDTSNGIDCDSSQRLNGIPYEISSEMERLSLSHYRKTTLFLARYLLGKYLVHKIYDRELIGRIVETEAYPGITDPASHTFGGKRSERNLAMYMEAGTAYVYTIYGMYNCVNVSSCDEGGAVLIRALEPVEGIDIMMSNRSEKRKSTSKQLKTHQLCNGPSKLCQAMKIDKTLNTVDMVTSKTFYIMGDERNERIGIDGYGDSASSQLYRFYIKGNKNVSVCDKNLENGVT